ncbi:MAG: hypothetical protein ACLT1C_05340 [Weissella confusa]
MKPKQHEMFRVKEATPKKKRFCSTEAYGKMKEGSLAESGIRDEILPEDFGTREH